MQVSAYLYLLKCLVQDSESVDVLSPHVIRSFIDQECLVKMFERICIDLHPNFQIHVRLLSELEAFPSDFRASVTCWLRKPSISRHVNRASSVLRFLGSWAGSVLNLLLYIFCVAFMLGLLFLGTYAVAKHAIILLRAMKPLNGLDFALMIIIITALCIAPNSGFVYVAEGLGKRLEFLRTCNSNMSLCFYKEQEE